MCGSAFKNKGVQPLLDAVVDLPAVADRTSPRIERRQAGTDERSSPQCVRTTSRSSALAFKIMNDPFVGTLTFMRVYSGVLQSAEQVLNTIKDKPERIGRMLQMHANNARGHQGGARRRHRRVAPA